MNFTRRQTLRLGLIAALMSTTQLARAQDIGLVFDPTAFQELTTTITTASGDHLVSYHFWQAVPYLSRPVDAAYQCLNVSVPVAIDGKPVDASQAPILFANNVGGYMPSAVGAAKTVDGADMGGPPPGAKDAPSGSAAMMAMGERVSLAKLGLAAGLVVVEPGARGRSLIDAAGIYYGTAPAAIVDLKAAVRFVKANTGRIPGNVEQIISTGTSAGGALSALLGATGDSPNYGSYLDALGAAPGSDAVFAAGCWCPITDLDHADMAYEWNWSANPLQDGGALNADLSKALAAAFADYQAGLGLKTPAGDALTTGTYPAYLLDSHLIPAATAHLAALSDADRNAYLAANPNIGWANGTATFDWPRFLAHVGARKKPCPSFDALDLSTGENNLFGTGTTQSRHFTTFGLRQASGDDTAQLDADILGLVQLMNPMPFLAAGNPGRVRHWWLRVGAKDSDTALSVIANLAAAATGQGDAADLRYYWDAGHGANEDAEAFMAWISQITGHPLSL